MKLLCRPYLIFSHSIISSFNTTPIRSKSTWLGSLNSHLPSAKLTFAGIQALAATSPFAWMSPVPTSTSTTALGFARDPKVCPASGTRLAARKLLVECCSVSIRHWFVVRALSCWSLQRRSWVTARRRSKAFRYFLHYYYCYCLQCFHFDWESER